MKEKRYILFRWQYTTSASNSSEDLTRNYPKPKNLSRFQLHKSPAYAQSDDILAISAAQTELPRDYSAGIPSHTAADMLTYIYTGRTEAHTHIVEGFAFFASENFSLRDFSRARRLSLRAPVFSVPGSAPRSSSLASIYTTARIVIFRAVRRGGYYDNADVVASFAAARDSCTETRKNARRPCGIEIAVSRNVEKMHGCVQRLLI